VRSETLSDAQQKLEEYERKISDYGQGMQILKDEYQTKFNKLNKSLEDSKIQIKVLERNIKTLTEQSKVANERAFEAESRVGKLQKQQKHLLEDREPSTQNDDAIDDELAEFENSLLESSASLNEYSENVDLDLNSVNIKSDNKKSNPATVVSKQTSTSKSDPPKFNVNPLHKGITPVKVSPNTGKTTVVTSNPKTVTPKTSTVVKPISSSTTTSSSSQSELDKELDNINQFLEEDTKRRSQTLLTATNNNNNTNNTTTPPTTKPKASTDWNMLESLITDIGKM